MPRAFRVVKLGGSLLSQTDLSARWCRWWRELPPRSTILVVGGGELVERIRRTQPRLGLSDDAAHGLALRVMTLNARRIARQLQEHLPGQVRWWSRWSEREIAGLAIMDPHALLHDLGPSHAGGLDRNWNVTSDSIAAWLAVRCGAQELILLKSRPPRRADFLLRPTETENDFVDVAFPDLARGIPQVRTVNFRDPAFPSVTLELGSP